MSIGLGLVKYQIYYKNLQRGRGNRVIPRQKAKGPFGKRERNRADVNRKKRNRVDQNKREKGGF